MSQHGLVKLIIVENGSFPLRAEVNAVLSAFIALSGP